MGVFNQHFGVRQFLLAACFALGLFCIFLLISRNSTGDTKIKYVYKLVTEKRGLLNNAQPTQISSNEPQTTRSPKEAFYPLKFDKKYILSQKCKELSETVFAQADLEKMCDSSFMKLPGMHNFCKVKGIERYKFPKIQGQFTVSVAATKLSKKLPMYTYSKADTVSQSILEGKQWERAETELVTKWLTENPEAQFIDIGSNLGIFTLTVAYGLKRKVVAMDANYNNVIRLGNTLYDNGVTDNVSLFWNAIHDQGNQTFMTFREEDGKCHIAAGLTGRVKPNPESTYSNNMTDAFVSVNASRIDSLLPYIKSLMKQAVLKIDIEGAEWTFFSSATELFKTIDIPYVFMEWLNLSKSQQSNILHFFGSRKYQPFTSTAMKALNISNIGYRGNLIWKKM